MWDDCDLLRQTDFRSYDFSPSRERRLRQVAPYILAHVHAKFGYDSTINPIVSMFDHKGTLTVTWKSESAKRQFASIAAKAWSIVGREPEGNIEHEIDCT